MVGGMVALKRREVALLPLSVGRSVPRSWLWIGLRGQMSDVAMEGRGKKGEVVGGEGEEGSGGGLRRDANYERD